MTRRACLGRAALCAVLACLSARGGALTSGQVRVEVGTFKGAAFVPVRRAPPGQLLTYRTTVTLTAPVRSMTFTVPLSSDFLYAGRLYMPRKTSVHFGNGGSFPPLLPATSVKVVKFTLRDLPKGEWRVSFNVLVR